MSNCEQRFFFVTVHKTLKIKRLFLHQRCVQLKGTSLMSLITFKKTKWLSEIQWVWGKYIFQGSIPKYNPKWVLNLQGTKFWDNFWKYLQVWRDISTPFSQVAPARWVLGRNSLTCNRRCEISWKDTFPLKTNMFFALTRDHCLKGNFWKSSKNFRGIS